MDRDLFGNEIAPAAPEVKGRRKTTVPRGHAWPPGSGPAAETCKTCAHYVVVHWDKSYRKCGLMRKAWSHGPGTDIRASDPACLKWEPKDAKRRED